MSRTQREQRTQRQRGTVFAQLTCWRATGSKDAVFVALTFCLAGASLVASASFASSASSSSPASSAVNRGAAATGAIHGRVEVRRPLAVVRRPTVSALGAPLERGRGNRAASVVYLESAPRGAFEQNEPGRAVMDQRNETFMPHVLAVTTGTTVDFPNSDRIYHNVFSLSKGARFDLGRYEVGHSRSVRFDRPGIVRVFCEIHSHMNAFILVFSHPFFAMTDAEGRYRVDRVPPGTYSVVAWNEGVSSEPRSATVPDGAATELDFSIR